MNKSKSDIVVLINKKLVKIPETSEVYKDICKANKSTSASAIFGKILK